MPRITILAPANRLLVTSLATRVHLGEAECLALALEHPESLLLLDDLAARELAATNGLLFTGTLGCLAEARKRGLIISLAPLLDDLRPKARFWIADGLATMQASESQETFLPSATGNSGPVRRVLNWPRKGVFGCDSNRAMRWRRKAKRGMVMAWGDTFRHRGRGEKSKTGSSPNI